MKSKKYETDKLLTEKEVSLKKKIFSLAKMESLVHSDPKLSAVYDDMVVNGEEKYGYHYNETIMNIIFNDYVLNSAQYLQKYKNAIPKKKKRRDKSGINQLKAKGEKEMTKKGLKPKNDENSEKEVKKTSKKKVDESINEKSITDVIFYLEEDGEVFAYFPNENHNSSGSLKICYSHIGQHSACHPNYVKNKEIATPEQYNDLKNELENQAGYDLNILTSLDETTSTGGAGSYSYATPHAWGDGDLMKGKKSKILKKPIWNGGSSVGEGVENRIEEIRKTINELEQKINNQMKENRKKDNFKQYVRNIKKGVIDPEEFDNDIDYYNKNKSRKNIRGNTNANDEHSIDEHHLTNLKDKIVYIKNAYKQIIGKGKSDSVLDILKYVGKENLDMIYNDTVDLLNLFGIDSKTISHTDLDTQTIHHGLRGINEDDLDEYGFGTITNKLTFIKNAYIKLVKIGKPLAVLNLLYSLSNDSIDSIYLDVEKKIENLGIDPMSVNHIGLDEVSIIDDKSNDETMANKMGSSSMEMGTSGGMHEENSIIESVNKEIWALETHQEQLKNLSEDRKTSSMVNKDRMGDENRKNFKKDLGFSGTKNVIDINKELEWKDHQEEIKNPKKYSEKIEKDVLKRTKGEALKNVGDSRNTKGDEIPKRNHTKEENEEIDMYREGMQSLDYDITNDDFEERVKNEMGEKLYNQGRKHVENKKKRPMYDKDQQPITAEINESILSGFYVDALNKRKIVSFKPKNVKLIENVGNLSKINFTGMENNCGYMFEINENVDKYLDSYSFYTNGNEVYRTNKILNESNSKIDITKMKHLINYDSKSHTDTSNVKINRGF